MILINKPFLRQACTLVVLAAFSSGGIPKSVVLADGLTQLRATDDPVQQRCVVVATSGSHETDEQACERALAAMPSNTADLPAGTHLFPGRDRRYAGGSCAYPSGWNPSAENKAICARLLTAMGKAKVAKAIEPESWVRDKDLKTLSGNAGSLLVSIGINPEGRATYCTVIQSSKNPHLDFLACQVISQRARFDPALDKDGQPISASYDRRWSF